MSMNTVKTYPKYGRSNGESWSVRDRDDREIQLTQHAERLRGQWEVRLRLHLGFGDVEAIFGIVWKRGVSENHRVKMLCGI